MRKKAIRAKEYKYIEAESEEDALCGYCNKIHGGINELYDLRKDPEEEENIIEEKSKIAGKLKKKLHEETKKYKKINEKRRLKIVLNKMKK